MFQHVVLFEVKKGTPQDNINEMLRGLRDLGKYPEVIDLTVGINYSPYNQCHTHGLVLRTKDRLELQNWESRPQIRCSHLREHLRSGPRVLAPLRPRPLPHSTAPETRLVPWLGGLT